MSTHCVEVEGGARVPPPLPKLRKHRAWRAAPGPRVEISILGVKVRVGLIGSRHARSHRYLAIVPGSTSFYI